MDRRSMGGDEGFYVGHRGSEHDLDRDERSQGGFLQGMVTGEAGGVAEVAGEHVGVADGRGVGGEGLGDGFFDESFLEADAEVAC